MSFRSWDGEICHLAYRRTLRSETCRHNRRVFRSACSSRASLGVVGELRLWRLDHAFSRVGLRNPGGRTSRMDRIRMHR